MLESKLFGTNFFVFFFSKFFKLWLTKQHNIIFILIKHTQLFGWLLQYFPQIHHIYGFCCTLLWPVLEIGLFLNDETLILFKIIYCLLRFYYLLFEYNIIKWPFVILFQQYIVVLLNFISFMRGTRKILLYWFLPKSMVRRN